MKLHFASTLIFALSVALGGGCSRSSSSVPATSAIVVSGVPTDVAARATRALQPSVAKQTEIVRVDRADDVVLRFSMLASDGSVRLVEVTLQAVGDTGGTNVAAVSRAFSFVMKPTRDRLDAETEAAVLAIVRKAGDSAVAP